MYTSETQKIRPKLYGYLSEKQRILDYGCGADKIFPWAIGVDIRPLPGVDIVTKDLLDVETAVKKEDGLWDAIYSSHFLEHVENDQLMIHRWAELLVPSGLLALYLPDDDFYDNDVNPEHLHRYKYLDFVESFKLNFKNLKLKASGRDVGDDKYSFWVLAEKM